LQESILKLTNLFVSTAKLWDRHSKHKQIKQKK